MVDAAEVGVGTLDGKAPVRKGSLQINISASHSGKYQSGRVAAASNTFWTVE